MQISFIKIRGHMKFKIYRSERFEKELAKFDKKFQERVDKIEDELVENPHRGSIWESDGSGKKDMKIIEFII